MKSRKTSKNSWQLNLITRIIMVSIYTESTKTSKNSWQLNLITRIIMMEFFPLLELPEEIQAVVVERAACNSIQDLFGLKASSRSMKALAERRGSCQCGNPVERDCPCLWHIDVTKDDNMCPHCLWLKEIGLFLREFEPVSLYRDTRKW
ncbi:hypothetical protein HID58_022616 [Brassica napus]|uniref:F-box domain-containing protein n=1 Tax=Brassica napus TaxID=3708 RepID=A0ABQ8D1F6_BRANA|nr:hypothetical protein HID58_022616 [Brassica napus]